MIKTIITTLFSLLIPSTIFAQLDFEKSRLSDTTLSCIYQIDNLTETPDFENIDSLRSKYAYLICMKLPYATDEELLELTNYSNKHVRLLAFDMLLTDRKKEEMILFVLEKNICDTLEHIEKKVGCIFTEMNVFQRMLDMTNEIDTYYTRSKKQAYFIGDNNRRWLKLKKLIVKQ